MGRPTNQKNLRKRLKKFAKKKRNVGNKRKKNDKIRNQSRRKDQNAKSTDLVWEDSVLKPLPKMMMMKLIQQRQKIHLKLKKMMNLELQQHHLPAKNTVKLKAGKIPNTPRNRKKEPQPPKRKIPPKFIQQENSEDLTADKNVLHLPIKLTQMLLEQETAHQEPKRSGKSYASKRKERQQQK